MESWQEISFNCMLQLHVHRQQEDEVLRRQVFNSIDMNGISENDLQYIQDDDHRCIAYYNELCHDSSDEDRMSPTMYLKTLIEARKMTEKQRQTPTLSRSKPTPGKNPAQCKACKNKAFQCVCDDEWCLDTRHKCKAFKRHSDCCGKVFARQIKETDCIEKREKLKQSYSMKRQNAEVSVLCFSQQAKEIKFRNESSI